MKPQAETRPLAQEAHSPATHPRLVQLADAMERGRPGTSKPAVPRPGALSREVDGAAPQLSQARFPLKQHVGMLLVTALIATSFPVAAGLAGSMNLAVLTLLRFLFAAVVLLPFVVLRHPREWRPSRTALVRYAALSAPLVGYFLSMFAALETTSAVHAGAVATFGPCFAALLAWLLLGERPVPRRLIALGTGLVGATWVVLGGEPTRLLAWDFARGDGIFLAGTAAFGLYTVLIRRLARSEPVAVATLWTLVTGVGWLLVYSGFELSAVPWSELDVPVLGAIAYLGLFTTLLTFLGSQWAVRGIGPTRVSAYTYLVPTLVALLAWTSGEAALEWKLLPGIALTLAAMLVLQAGPAAVVVERQPSL